MTDKSSKSTSVGWGLIVISVIMPVLSLLTQQASLSDANQATNYYSLQNTLQVVILFDFISIATSLSALIYFILSVRKRPSFSSAIGLIISGMIVLLQMLIIIASTFD